MKANTKSSKKTPHAGIKVFNALQEKVRKNRRRLSDVPLLIHPEDVSALERLDLDDWRSLEIVRGEEIMTALTLQDLEPLSRYGLCFAIGMPGLEASDEAVRIL